MPGTSPLSVTQHSPQYWHVTFDNPPINLVDPVLIVALNELLTAIEQDTRVAVVVFDSADPEFFIAHYDLAADPAPLDVLPAAPTPLHHWGNLLIRLAKSRAVTITALRGRARGTGSELALATDIRFASRERAVLGQFEVGIGAVPAGGPSTRLPGIVGRGRAFEILLGGEDFTADLAERYGYVNRAVPDAEFPDFVDAFAQRVSRFEPLALAEVKRLVNAVSQPADDALTAEMDASAESVTRPALQGRVSEAIKQGLQQRSDTELNLGAYVGTLARTESSKK